MTTTPPHHRADDLDRLLSGFFKAQVPDPWPSAPPAARAEPSELAARAPRNVPDAGRRARYTLAASVALLVGTCWALSNGFQSGGRPAGPVPPRGGDLDLRHGSADGKNGLPDLMRKAEPPPALEKVEPLDPDKLD